MYRAALIVLFFVTLSHAGTGVVPLSFKQLKNLGKPAEPVNKRLETSTADIAAVTFSTAVKQEPARRADKSNAPAKKVQGLLEKKTSTPMSVTSPQPGKQDLAGRADKNAVPAKKDNDLRGKLKELGKATESSNKAVETSTPSVISSRPGKQNLTGHTAKSVVPVKKEKELHGKLKELDKSTVSSNRRVETRTLEPVASSHAGKHKQNRQADKTGTMAPEAKGFSGITEVPIFLKDRTASVLYEQLEELGEPTESSGFNIEASASGIAELVTITVPELVENVTISEKNNYTTVSYYSDVILENVMQPTAEMVTSITPSVKHTIAVQNDFELTTGFNLSATTIGQAIKPILNKPIKLNTTVIDAPEHLFKELFPNGTFSVLNNRSIHDFPLTHNLTLHDSATGHSSSMDFSGLDVPFVAGIEPLSGLMNSYPESFEDILGFEHVPAEFVFNLAVNNEHGTSLNVKLFEENKAFCLASALNDKPECKTNCSEFFLNLYVDYINSTVACPYSYEEFYAGFSKAYTENLTMKMLLDDLYGSDLFPIGSASHKIFSFSNVWTTNVFLQDHTFYVNGTECMLPCSFKTDHVDCFSSSVFESFFENKVTDHLEYVQDPFFKDLVADLSQQDLELDEVKPNHTTKSEILLPAIALSDTDTGAVRPRLVSGAIAGDVPDNVLIEKKTRFMELFGAEAADGGNVKYASASLLLAIALVRVNPIFAMVVSMTDVVESIPLYKPRNISAVDPIIQYAISAAFFYVVVVLFRYLFRTLFYASATALMSKFSFGTLVKLTSFFMLLFFLSYIPMTKAVPMPYGSECRVNVAHPAVDENQLTVRFNSFNRKVPSTKNMINFELVSYNPIRIGTRSSYRRNDGEYRGEYGRFYAEYETALPAIRHELGIIFPTKRAFEDYFFHSIFPHVRKFYSRAEGNPMCYFKHIYDMLKHQDFVPTRTRKLNKRITVGGFSGHPTRPQKQIITAVNFYSTPRASDDFYRVDYFISGIPVDTPFRIFGTHNFGLQQGYRLFDKNRAGKELFQELTLDSPGYTPQNGMTSTFSTCHLSYFYPTIVSRSPFFFPEHAHGLLLEAMAGSTNLHGTCRDFNLNLFKVAIEARAYFHLRGAEGELRDDGLFNWNGFKTVLPEDALYKYPGARYEECFLSTRLYRENWTLQSDGLYRARFGGEFALPVNLVAKGRREYDPTINPRNVENWKLRIFTADSKGLQTNKALYERGSMFTIHGLWNDVEPADAWDCGTMTKTCQQQSDRFTSLGITDGKDFHFVPITDTSYGHEYRKHAFPWKLTADAYWEMIVSWQSVLKKPLFYPTQCRYDSTLECNVIQQAETDSSSRSALVGCKDGKPFCYITEVVDIPFMPISSVGLQHSLLHGWNYNISEICPSFMLNGITGLPLEYPLRGSAYDYNIELMRNLTRVCQDWQNTANGKPFSEPATFDLRVYDGVLSNPRTFLFPKTPIENVKRRFADQWTWRNLFMHKLWEDVMGVPIACAGESCSPSGNLSVLILLVSFLCRNKLLAYLGIATVLISMLTGANATDLGEGSVKLLSSNFDNFVNNYRLYKVESLLEAGEFNLPFEPHPHSGSCAIQQDVIPSFSHDDCFTNPGQTQSCGNFDQTLCERQGCCYHPEGRHRCARKATSALQESVDMKDINHKTVEKLLGCETLYANLTFRADGVDILSGPSVTHCAIRGYEFNIANATAEVKTSLKAYTNGDNTTDYRRVYVMSCKGPVLPAFGYSLEISDYFHDTRSAGFARCVERNGKCLRYAAGSPMVVEYATGLMDTFTTSPLQDFEIDIEQFLSISFQTDGFVKVKVVVGTEEVLNGWVHGEYKFRSEDNLCYYDHCTVTIGDHVNTYGQEEYFCPLQGWLFTLVRIEFICKQVSPDMAVYFAMMSWLFLFILVVCLPFGLWDVLINVLYFVIFLVLFFPFYLTWLLSYPLRRFSSNPSINGLNNPLSWYNQIARFFGYAYLCFKYISKRFRGYNLDFSTFLVVQGFNRAEKFDAQDPEVALRDTVVELQSQGSTSMETQLYELLSTSLTQPQLKSNYHMVVQYMTQLVNASNVGITSILKKSPLEPIFQGFFKSFLRRYTPAMFQTASRKFLQLIKSTAITEGKYTEKLKKLCEQTATAIDDMPKINPLLETTHLCYSIVNAPQVPSHKGFQSLDEYVGAVADLFATPGEPKHKLRSKLLRIVSNTDLVGAEKSLKQEYKYTKVTYKDTTLELCSEHVQMFAVHIPVLTRLCTSLDTPAKQCTYHFLELCADVDAALQKLVTLTKKSFFKSDDKDVYDASQSLSTAIHELEASYDHGVEPPARIKLKFLYICHFLDKAVTFNLQKIAEDKPLINLLFSLDVFSTTFDDDMDRVTEKLGLHGYEKDPAPADDTKAALSVKGDGDDDEFETVVLEDTLVTPSGTKVTVTPLSSDRSDNGDAYEYTDLIMLVNGVSKDDQKAMFQSDTLVLKKLIQRILFTVLNLPATYDAPIWFRSVDKNGLTHGDPVRISATSASWFFELKRALQTKHRIQFISNEQDVNMQTPSVARAAKAAILLSLLPTVSGHDGNDLHGVAADSEPVMVLIICSVLALASCVMLKMIMNLFKRMKSRKSLKIIREVRIRQKGPTGRIINIELKKEFDEKAFVHEIKCDQNGTIRYNSTSTLGNLFSMAAVWTLGLGGAEGATTSSTPSDTVPNRLPLIVASSIFASTVTFYLFLQIFLLVRDYLRKRREIMVAVYKMDDTLYCKQHNSYKPAEAVSFSSGGRLIEYISSFKMTLPKHSVLPLVFTLIPNVSAQAVVAEPCNCSGLQIALTITSLLSLVLILYIFRRYVKACFNVSKRTIKKIKKKPESEIPVVTSYSKLASTRHSALLSKHMACVCILGFLSLPLSQGILLRRDSQMGISELYNDKMSRTTEYTFVNEGTDGVYTLKVKYSDIHVVTRFETEYQQCKSMAGFYFEGNTCYGGHPTNLLLTKRTKETEDHFNGIGGIAYSNPYFKWMCNKFPLRYADNCHPGTHLGGHDYRKMFGEFKPKRDYYLSDVFYGGIYFYPSPIDVAIPDVTVNYPYKFAENRKNPLQAHKNPRDDEMKDFNMKTGKGKVTSNGVFNIASKTKYGTTVYAELATEYNGICPNDRMRGNKMPTYNLQYEYNHAVVYMCCADATDCNCDAPFYYCNHLKIKPRGCLVALGGENDQYKGEGGKIRYSFQTAGKLFDWRIMTTLSFELSLSGTDPETNASVTQILGTQKYLNGSTFDMREHTQFTVDFSGFKVSLTQTLTNIDKNLVEGLKAVRYKGKYYKYEWSNSANIGTFGDNRVYKDINFDNVKDLSSLPNFEDRYFDGEKPKFYQYGYDFLATFKLQLPIKRAYVYAPQEHQDNDNSFENFEFSETQQNRDTLTFRRIKKADGWTNFDESARNGKYPVLSLAKTTAGLRLDTENRIANSVFSLSVLSATGDFPTLKGGVVYGNGKITCSTTMVSRGVINFNPAEFQFTCVLKTGASGRFKLSSAYSLYPKHKYLRLQQRTTFNVEIFGDKPKLNITLKIGENEITVKGLYDPRSIEQANDTVAEVSLTYDPLLDELSSQPRTSQGGGGFGFGGINLGGVGGFFSGLFSSLTSTLKTLAIVAVITAVIGGGIYFYIKSGSYRSRAKYD